MSSFVDKFLQKVTIGIEFITKNKTVQTKFKKKTFDF